MSEVAPLKCPFCGRPPTVDRRGFRLYENTAWTFIRCSCCRVSPMVSGSASTGYHEYNRPWAWVETKSKEQAEQESYDWAVRGWNERAPTEAV